MIDAYTTRELAIEAISEDIKSFVEDKGFYQVIYSQLDIMGRALDAIEEELDKKEKEKL